VDVRLAIDNIPRVYLDKFKLAGRNALITGAGRGIGLSMARALSEAGAAVAIQDIDLAVARREVDHLQLQSRRAVAIGGDAASDTFARDTHAAAVAALGPIDILINNAAIQDRVPFPERTRNQSEQIWRANVWAAMELCQLVLPHMKEQHWGRIVNIGSIQGTRGVADMVPYSLSKSAIANLTHTLAHHVGKFGVTVNTISPGYFKTFRNEGKDVPTDVEPEKSDWIPIGRHGKADDCAGAALLLCSDAGEYITGQTIAVNGGMNF
jgi:NAD(P)-dependent dehydrogenase (short-subunit alcohol dehydrogenase family)